MKRKPSKSLPWRRLGYVVLIIVKFSELLFWLSLRIINALRSYIKHLKECFIRYPTLKSWFKKTPLFFNSLLSVWISDETLFQVFDILLEIMSFDGKASLTQIAARKPFRVIEKRANNLTSQTRWRRCISPNSMFVPVLPREYVRNLTGRGFSLSVGVSRCSLWLWSVCWRQFGELFHSERLGASCRWS